MEGLHGIVNLLIIEDVWTVLSINGGFVIYANGTLHAYNF